MLIVLDIGNTAVTYGISQKGRLSKHGSCLFYDIPKIIDKCYKSGDDNCFNVLLSSVVPLNTKKLEIFLRKKRGVIVQVVGKDIPVPMKSHYFQGQLGIDRLVTAYGASEIYGSPVLVMDFGTGLTLDYVSKNGVFEGGMIVPGPELAFQALIKRAALLPKTARLPYKRTAFLGRNTQECLESGILEGYGAMTDHLIARFRKKFGPGLRVVATGGFAKHLKPYSQTSWILDPQLSIKSLIKIAQTKGLH